MKAVCVVHELFMNVTTGPIRHEKILSHNQSITVVVRPIVWCALSQRMLMFVNKKSDSQPTYGVQVPRPGPETQSNSDEENRVRPPVRLSWSLNGKSTTIYSVLCPRLRSLFIFV